MHNDAHVTDQLSRERYTHSASLYALHLDRLYPAKAWIMERMMYTFVLAGRSE